jgi:DNA-binding MarR family transcriptional regulator
VTSAATTRWLTDAELDAWIGLIKLSARLVSLSDGELRRRHAISGRDYEMLHHLSQHRDGLRLTELAQHIEDSSSCITHRVNRLGAAGLVAKGPDPDDRRAKRVGITAKGRALMHEAAPAHVERVRRWVFDGLDVADVAVVARLADTLNAHLRVVEPFV